MGFTNRCYVRTSDKSLIGRLKSIGRHFDNHIDDSYNFPIVNCMIINDDMHSCIIYCHDGRIDDTNIDLEKAIDCGCDESLFLAIAAMRDDTDRHQYFVLDTDVSYYGNVTPKGNFFICEEHKAVVDFDKDGNPDVFSSRNIPAHKATVEELINHFK